MDTLLKTAWGYYAERIVKLQPEPTVGSRMNVKLGLLHNVILQRVPGNRHRTDYVIELVADAVWRIYRLWSTLALGMVLVTPGKITSSPSQSQAWDPRGRVSLSFSFNAPGYLIEAAPADSGTALDVVRFNRSLFRVLVQP